VDALAKPLYKPKKTSLRRDCLFSDVARGTGGAEGPRARRGRPWLPCARWMLFAMWCAVLPGPSGEGAAAAHEAKDFESR